MNKMGIIRPFENKGSNKKYQINGWYKICMGATEEIEDKRTYNAEDKKSALTMARKDGLSRLVSVDEIVRVKADLPPGLLSKLSKILNPKQI
tara:strand:- start:2259 stop:2534 length:276 start_codon:yes stop_codon:yes gene_type:complete